MIRASRDVVNAWWRAVEDPNLTEPNFVSLSKEYSYYTVHNRARGDIESISAGMEIYISPVTPVMSSSEVRVWVTGTMKDWEEYSFHTGSQPAIDRNLPEQQILDAWKGEHGRRDEYREIIARLPEDAGDQLRPRGRMVR
jgi:hypothetical protein